MPILELREQEMSVNPSSLAAQEASTSSKDIYSVMLSGGVPTPPPVCSSPQSECHSVCFF